MQAAEQNFDVAGLQLTAKRWGVPGGVPVLALHGWLDNAASFDYLAPLLRDCDLVCLDCAGHGKSGHRGFLGAYNIWQDIGEIFHVADQLGWQTFALIGHSRGAMTSFLAAGTFPSRISHLILIEGGHPRVAAADAAPALLAESIRSVRVAMARQRQYYSSFDLAVAARINGIFPIARADAEVLAQRGVAETEHGFFWSYDPKLIAGSEIRLTVEQVEAFRQRVVAQTLVVIADKGLVAEPQAHGWLARSPHWRQVLLPGGHHLHMHSQHVAVAQAIREHLGHLTSEENP